MSVIADAMEGLYLVYHPKNPLDAESLRKLMGNYKIALEGATPDQVKRACVIWQYERDQRYPHFPLPNELKAIIDSLKPRPAAGPKPQAWRILSSGDVEALTMPERARYYRILADHIRGKAGPTYRHGKPVDWRDMPPEWHQAQALADEYCRRAAAIEGRLIERKASQERVSKSDYQTLSDLMSVVTPRSLREYPDDQ